MTVRGVTLLQKRNELHGVLLACALFGFPIMSAIPVLMSMDSRPVSVLYRLVVAGLTVLFMWQVRQDGCPRLRGPVVVAMAALVTCLLARMAWDSTAVPLPLYLPWESQWLIVLGMTLFPALAFCAIPNEGTVDTLRKYSVVAGILAIFSILISVAFILGDVRNFRRLSTDVLNAISVGHAAVSCLIVLNARAISGEPQRGFIKGIARWTMNLMCVAVLLASGSKGPLVAFVAVVAMAILFGGRTRLTFRNFLTRVVVIVSVLLLAVSVVLVVEMYTPFRISTRVLDLAYDPSTSLRVMSMNGALTQFEQSPLLGSAFVERSTRYYPHNIILESMMTTGVIGLALLVFILVGLARATLLLLVTYSKYRWIGLLSVQYFIDSMFSGSLYLSPHFWAVSLLTLSCEYFLRTRSVRPEKTLTRTFVAAETYRA